MLTFKADDWYEIKDRGQVAAIGMLPEAFYEQYYDPDELKGELVEIDGKVYKVEGVESFCIYRSIDFPYRHSVGLLVTEV